MSNKSCYENYRIVNCLIILILSKKIVWLVLSFLIQIIMFLQNFNNSIILQLIGKYKAEYFNKESWVIIILVARLFLSKKFQMTEHLKLKIKSS